jgi:hypothetical protein
MTGYLFSGLRHSLVGYQLRRHQLDTHRHDIQPPALPLYLGHSTSAQDTLMATEFLSTYYSSSAHSLRRRLGTGAILFGKQESLDIITNHLQNLPP